MTAGHPAHLVLLGVAAVGGVALALWRRTPSWLVVASAVILLAPLLYLQPFRATQDGDGATVLRPDGPVRAGLVFHLGTRVDYRAYLPLLSGDTAPLRAEHAEVPVWAVGGHSLGGVAAARDVLADSSVRGLVLWGSYPVDDLSGRDGLEAWSIHGQQDGFTTPQDIAGSRNLLPADTRFEQVPGAVHAFFGDYGDQPGDGVPTVSRAEAQDEIVAHTTAALAETGRSVSAIRNN